MNTKWVLPNPELASCELESVTSAVPAFQATHHAAGHAPLYPSVAFAEAWEWRSKWLLRDGVTGVAETNFSAAAHPCVPVRDGRNGGARASNAAPILDHAPSKRGRHHRCPVSFRVGGGRDQQGKSERK